MSDTIEDAIGAVRDRVGDVADATATGAHRALERATAVAAVGADVADRHRRHLGRRLLLLVLLVSGVAAVVVVVLRRPSFRAETEEQEDTWTTPPRREAGAGPVSRPDAASA